MFINCPHCKALIATDPATDLPPLKCPRCAAGLRETTSAPDAPASTSPHANAIDATSPADIRVATEPSILSAPPTAGTMDAVPADPETVDRAVADKQVRADLPTAIAAAIAPVSTLLKPAPQASAEPPAAIPAQDTTTRVPAPEAGTVPAPENEAAAAPAADAASAPQTPVERAAADTGAPTSAPTSAPTGVVDASTTTPEAPPDDGATSQAAAAPKAASNATVATTTLPSFARTGTLPHHGFGWKTITAAAALALLLSLQLLLAGRAQLADDARWRPLASTLCSVFGCTLPPWRESAAFTVLARDVRPHPSLSGVLRVTATLRNDARWPQPWPRLRLTLSDVDGNPVATRDFAAREYLGARSPPPQIASGQSAAFAMDIVEPVSRSVAFDFELH